MTAITHNISEFTSQLPKVELHRHLEGSLSPEIIYDLFQKFPEFDRDIGVEEIRGKALLLHPLKEFPLILAKFDYARQCFIHREAIEFITYEVCRSAAAENIKLLELRYSPGFIAENHGHDFSMIHEAVCAGKTRAEKDFDIIVGLIIICSRDYRELQAARSIDFAIENKDSIVGFDLAGDETVEPSLFIDQFERLRNAGIPVTVHAGETMGPENIITAIRDLHADRIGHGVTIYQDPLAVKLAIENNIVFEQCPTSNYRTCSVDIADKHPIRKLFDLGLKISINSDDPGLFGINLSSEFDFCLIDLGLGHSHIKKSIQNSLSASFMDNALKQQISRKYFPKK